MKTNLIPNPYSLIPNTKVGILSIAMCFTFFACSSGNNDDGGGVSSNDSNGILSGYICQLSNNNCIRLETVYDCTIAGGYVVDVCQALSSSSNSLSEFNQSSGGSSPNVSSSSLDVKVSSSSSIDSYSGEYGELIYDGQKYKTVVIGTQIWMAENLNYTIDVSACYDYSSYNCAKYGRLYDWETAKTVCPSGWHLPTNADWDALFSFVDSENDGYGEGSNPYRSGTAGIYLKATNGWNDYGGVSGNGKDSYGFAALPGGSAGYLDDSKLDSQDIGNFGFWWSAESSNKPHYRGMFYEVDGANSFEYSYYDIENHNMLLSVRCLKDLNDSSYK